MPIGSKMKTAGKLWRKWGRMVVLALAVIGPIDGTLATNAALARGGGGSGGMGGSMGGSMGGFRGGMTGSGMGMGTGMGGSGMSGGTPAGSAMHIGGFVADEVVVVDRDAQFLERLGRIGYEVIDRRMLGSLGISVARLRIPAGLTPDDARTQLQQMDPSVAVDVNALYQPQAQVTLPAPAYPHRLIGWNDAGDDCGAGQRLGMIDTAIDAGIPALADRRLVRRSFLSKGTPAPADHGTAIADLLIGREATDAPAGLLPGATLYAAAVFEDGRDGQPEGDVVALVTALDWMIAEDVPVINLSLAGDANLLLRIGIQRAQSRHILVVAAAGNGGPDGRPAYPGVLAVTAVDQNRQAYEQANRGDYIAFAAPGVHVWDSTAQGGQYFTGTSFATPFLSGAVAAELMRGAPRDADQMTQRLARTAFALGSRGRDAVFGWGLIQANPECGH